MDIESSVHTIKSTHHMINEDRYRILGSNVPLVKSSDKGQIYGVMDGVSGVSRGKEAAQYIADQLIVFYKQNSNLSQFEELHQLLYQINTEIFEWGMMPGKNQPLGAAAATIMWFAPTKELYVFHAGDTCAFHYTNNGMKSLTSPHEREGILQNYFGQGKDFQMDIHKVTPEEGDIFVILSDGVTKSLSTPDIQKIIEGFQRVDRISKEIVQSSLRQGSNDDITALTIELTEW